MVSTTPNLKVCIAAYTHALKDLIATGLEHKYRNGIQVMTYHQLIKQQKKYDVILLDEVQDIPNDVLQQITSLTKKLIIAGDTDQSIYGQGATSESIHEILNPKTYSLTVIYRLTRKMIDIVKTILPGSQIEGVPTGRMQDVQVSLAKAESVDQEITWVMSMAEKYSQSGDPAAVLLPGHENIRKFIEFTCALHGQSAPEFKRSVRPNGGQSGAWDYDAINQKLAEKHIDLRYLGNAFGSLPESDERALTYIMTYHSSKGLDFETVFLPHLNDSQSFWRNDPLIDRRLFFVGATRSRRNLFLSYHSQSPHRYVGDMPQSLLNHMTCEIRESIVEDDVAF